MNKKKDLLRSILETPIERIIGNYIELTQMGRDFLGLCPFHNDTSLGSFKVAPHLGIYKCFACGEGGDSIKFVANFFKITRDEAIIKIGRDLKLMDEESLKDIEKEIGKYDKIKNAAILKEVRKELPKTNFKEDRIADIETRNLVYTEFLNLLRLRSEDALYLINERQLSLQEINEIGFKTAESFDRDIMLKLIKAVGKKNLKYIPGFFKGYADGVTDIRYSNQDGIFLPLRNEKGEIYSLQVRNREKKENTSRYKFFTSSFAKTERFNFSGASAKSGYDVVYPKKIINSTVFITEGKFKAIQIAKFFSSVAISLQGVTSFKEDELNEVIKNISKEKNFPVKRVCIAYDADIFFNDAVRKAAIKLQKGLEIPSIFLCWNESKGKGIDDLIINQKYKETKDILNDAFTLLSIEGEDAVLEYEKRA